MKAGVLALAALLVLPMAPALAADEVRPPTAEEVAAKRERAQSMRTRAKNLRQSAEVAHQRESAECRQQLLVNNCLNRARDRQLELIEAARALEMEVGGLEREVRAYEIAERRAERVRRLEERTRPATISVEGARPKVLAPEAAPAAASAVPPAEAETPK